MTTVADILGPDGAAGDPQMLRSTASAIDTAGSHAVQLASRLKAFESGTWRGPARYRYERLRDQQVEQRLSVFAPAYEAAEAALRTYADALQQLQRRARSLVVATNLQAESLATSRKQLGHASTAVTIARAAQRLTIANPIEHLAAQAVVDHATANHARAQGKVSEGEAELRRMATIGHRLREELDAAAARLVGQLGGITPPAAGTAGGGAAAAVGVSAVATGVIVKFVTDARREVDQIGRDHRVDTGLREQWNATPVRPSGPKSIRNASIAEIAIAEGARHRAEGSKGGQCLSWVREILIRAGVNVGFFGDDVSTYAGQWKQYGIEIGDHNELMPGDVLQRPGGPGLVPHTMIVTNGGPPVTVIDSNYDYHEHVSAPHVVSKSYLDNFTAWRVGQV